MRDLPEMRAEVREIGPGGGSGSGDITGSAEQGGKRWDPHWTLAMCHGPVFAASPRPIRTVTWCGGGPLCPHRGGGETEAWMGGRQTAQGGSSAEVKVMVTPTPMPVLSRRPWQVL